MAFTVDHQRQAVFKHFCKICKKGFRCGRALGGHMRAHGVGVESGYLDDEEEEEEDPTSDWEDKLQVTKRMYALRTNPNRLKSCRACENCGKEFLSWKSLLEHGKCTNSDDAESLVSSPPSNEEDETSRGRWYKRKRSLRGKFGLSEEEDLANCLILLSKATVDPFLLEAEPEESCASASKDERPSDPLNFKFFSLQDNKPKGVNKTGLFECKACKKVFNSHQALGGHRASHKKVKGCFASRPDQTHHHNNNNNNNNNLVHAHDDEAITQENRLFDHMNNAVVLHGSSSNSKRKTKVHKCSICFREFSSGQALGGHKRCHWITSNPSSDPKFHQFNHERKLWNIQTDKPLDLDLNLDLNLPTNVGAATQTPCNTTKIQVSTEICLQSWIGVSGRPNNNDVPADYNENNNNSIGSTYQHVEDETESKVKLAKLSDLKDMNTTGNSAPWLQVGIGSTIDLGSDL